MSSDREPVWRYRKALASILTCLILISVSRSCIAQLQITEVMFNPLDEAAWEWIEVRNTDPNDLDLDGAYLHSLNRDRILGGTSPNINAGQANNTVVPAGGTAVLYNGQAPGIPDLASGDQVFRDAWNLGAPNSVSLIAVNNFPSLDSAIDDMGSIGIWANISDYEADLAEPVPGQFVVGGFDNSLAGLDFRSNFPTPPDGSSMYWNGTGSDQNGVNWTASVSGMFGAQTSVAASIGSGSANNPNDLANPGIIPNIPASNELLITEMMIDPASTEPDWEWIEIYNGGAPIDFSTPGTGYVFDDDDGDDLLTANITSGSIQSGGIAVLFNADAITQQDMIDAWDGGNPNTINFIPVVNFPSLDNNTDRLGIWSSFSDYSTDNDPNTERTFLETASTLQYNNSWPSSPFGRESIYLIDLDFDQDDGFNWEISDPNFSEDPNSYFASAVSGGTEIHAGGDIGSPGSIDPNSVANDADFDDDGIVSGLDFLIWQQGFMAGTTNATGDTNSDAAVNNTDLAVWEAQYPSAATVPSTPDINGDGRVDGLDFLAWQRGEGNTNLAAWEALYGTTFSISAVSTVPEPTNFTLLCMLITFSSRHRTRAISF